MPDKKLTELQEQFVGDKNSSDKFYIVTAAGASKFIRYSTMVSLLGELNKHSKLAEGTSNEVSAAQIKEALLDSHTQNTDLGTSSANFTIGIGESGDINVFWGDGGAGIRYNTSTSPDVLEFSHDGITWSQLGTSEIIDNLTSNSTQQALSANQGRLLNETKADLVGGKVPSSQLPAYVDDVLEFANLAAFPVSGSSGIIYIAIDSNFEYRWSGSTYIQLVASPGSTDAVPEGATNKYFTNARAIAAILTGYAKAITNRAIAATDSILLAFGVLEKRIDDNTTSINGKEPSLGNPSSDGQVLSSTSTGSRSWVTPSGVSKLYEYSAAIQPVNSFDQYFKKAGKLTSVDFGPGLTDLKVQINGGVQQTLTPVSGTWTGTINYATDSVLTFIPTSNTSRALFIFKGEEN